MGVAALLDSATASACEPTTVCLFWSGGFEDSGAGESVLPASSLVKASGARVTVIPPNPESPFTTLLDQDGCVTFETQFSYGHKMVVHGDAVVAGVRLVPAISDYGKLPSEFPLYRWDVHLHGLVPGGLAYGSIGMEADADAGDRRFRFLPIIAAATVTLQRFADLGIMPPGLAADETIYLSYTPGFGNARCAACTGGSQSRLEIGPDSFAEKFLIAHELGHWLQSRWSGNGTGARDYFYGPDSGFAFNAPCRFRVDMNPMLDEDADEPENTDAAFHGIRSAEFSSAGMVEGFAHFVSTLTFNDPSDEAAYFRYYKDITDNNHDEFLAAGSVVAAHGGAAADTPGGASRWVELQCPDDWASGPASDEVTSGMDWMRFWWRFATDQPVPQDLTLDLIFEFVATVQQDPGFAWSDLEVWNPLSAAAADPSFGISAYSGRFTAIGDQEGVDNDQ